MSFVFLLFGGISVFAADPSPADFKDNFEIYRFLAYDVPSDDFSYSYSNADGGDGRSTSTTYKGDAEDCPPSFAYSFRIVSDNSQFKMVLPPDYVVMGRVWFNLILPINDVTELQTASVLEYKLSKGDFWSISAKNKISDIDFIEKLNTYEYGTEWCCCADLYYLNDTSADIDTNEISFQFMFRLKNVFAAPSPYRVASFDIQVQDYYYGRSDNPNIPSFENFEDFQKGVDDYNNTEDEVKDLFKSTFNNYLDFGSWETLLTHIMPSITVSTNLLNSWFRLSF